MVTAVPIKHVGKAEWVYECHDTERGYRCNVTMYVEHPATGRVVEIATGHFDAKARAEAKAL
jgi:hypothetical protein